MGRLLTGSALFWRETGSTEALLCDPQVVATMEAVLLLRHAAAMGGLLTGSMLF